MSVDTRSRDTQTKIGFRSRKRRDAAVKSMESENNPDFEASKVDEACIREKLGLSQPLSSPKKILSPRKENGSTVSLEVLRSPRKRLFTDGKHFF